MARTAWVLAVALVACGGSSGETELFGTDGVSGADAGHDAARGAEDGAAGEDGAAPMVCAPGKVEACPCPGGGQGAQACRDDGSGFEPCECSVGDGGSGGAGGSGGEGGINNGGDPDPLPYDCETTFACECKPDPGDTWCSTDPKINSDYTNLYHGCTGRPKHCQAVPGHSGWWCCKY